MHNKNTKLNIFALLIKMSFFTQIVVANETHIHNFSKLTILTQQIGLTSSPKYGGHYAVTRSLLDGLNSLNIPFNYNPATFEEVGDVVAVLSDIDALKQAIMLKKIGRIKKLFAGPNLMVRADEYNSIMALPEVDAVIVPCEWVKIAYEEQVPSLISRIRIWYVGIDENFWQPSTEIKTKVLVYWKTESEEFCTAVEKLIKKYGGDPIRIKYGTYNCDEFRKALAQSQYAVFISISESQGIALAETWAMNVPTLIWNCKNLTAHGRIYSAVSACPYLNPSVGFDWINLAEFEALLQTMPQLMYKVNPNKWVLENMTDKKCAKKFIDIINGIHI